MIHVSNPLPSIIYLQTFISSWGHFGQYIFATSRVIFLQHSINDFTQGAAAENFVGVVTRQQIYTLHCVFPRRETRQNLFHLALVARQLCQDQLAFLSKIKISSIMSSLCTNFTTLRGLEMQP